jgi:Cu2+-exporting ATPase
LEKFKELNRPLPQIEDSKYTMGLGIMASVFTNNVAAIAALANGIMPLREVARLQARQEMEQQLRLALNRVE